MSARLPETAPWFPQRLLASLTVAMLLIGLPGALLIVGWGMPS